MCRGCWRPPTWLSCRAPTKDCPTWCSRRCGFASRSSPPLRRGRPRSSSTVRPGLLVPIGNALLLARAIRDVVRDPVCWQPHWARRAGLASRVNFRVDTMVAQFAELIRELARSKGISHNGLEITNHADSASDSIQSDCLPRLSWPGCRRAG